MPGSDRVGCSVVSEVGVSGVDEDWWRRSTRLPIISRDRGAGLLVGE